MAGAEAFATELQVCTAHAPRRPVDNLTGGEALVSPTASAQFGRQCGGPGKPNKRKV